MSRVPPKDFSKEFNKELIFSQVKLLLSEEITELNKAVHEQVDGIFKDRIDPLVRKVATESANLAAESAIKKYCSRIGVDFDNVESMQEHNIDMMFLRKLRKERENVRVLVLQYIVRTALLIVTTGIAVTVIEKFILQH